MPRITPLLSFSVLKCQSIRTQEFLQGQLTCDMHPLLDHGTYSLAACCDHRGRMLANFWVVNWQGDYLIVLPHSLADTLKNHLQKYALFSKVILSHDNSFFIAELSHWQDEKNDGIYIALPSQQRFLFIANYNPFTNREINTDETQWKKNNIADELGLVTPKTSLLFTPAMLNLDKLGGVSFTKGCYVGQEIVARTHYLGTLKRHLKRLQVRHPVPVTPGAELKNDAGDVIGIVVETVLIDHAQYDVLAVVQDTKGQSANGTSPLAASKTVREPLDSHGFRQANPPVNPFFQCANRVGCFFMSPSRNIAASVL